MKNLVLFFVFLISTMGFTQDLPSEPSKGFAFPLGSRFTIQLIPTDDSHFLYTIIAFEPFEDIIDTFDHEDLFEDKPKDGTLDFVFCIGTRGKDDAEREKNMKILLLIKNNSEHALSYDSDIQHTEEGEFVSTSNVGSFSGVKTTEMWPYMIYQIGLHNFRKYNPDK